MICKYTPIFSSAALSCVLFVEKSIHAKGERPLEPVVKLGANRINGESNSDEIDGKRLAT